MSSKISAEARVKVLEAKVASLQDTGKEAIKEARNHLALALAALAEHELCAGKAAANLALAQLQLSKAMAVDCQIAVEVMKAAAEGGDFTFTLQAREAG